MELSNSKHRQLGTIIYWTMMVSQIIISLFLTPFMIKTVGDRNYGVYSFAISMLNWLDVFLISLGSGYSRFLTREHNLNGERGEIRANNVFMKTYIILTSFFAIVGLIIISFVLFGIIPLEQYSGDEIKIISLIMLFSLLATCTSTLTSCHKGYYFYKQKYFTTYLINLSAILLQGLFSFLFLSFGLNVAFVAIAHFGFNILMSIAQSVYAKSVYKEKIFLPNPTEEDKRLQKILLSEILVFSIFVVFNTIADILNRNVDLIILGFVNSDAVGGYNIAAMFGTYLVNFTAIIGGVFAQRANHLYFDEKNEDKLDTLFKRTSFIQLCLCFLLIGGFIASGDNFLHAWVGENYANLYYVTIALLLSVSFVCSSTLSVTYRRMRNVHKKASLIYLFIILFNIGLSILFCNILPHNSAIWGCVIGTLISSFVGQWVILGIYDKKYSKIDLLSYVILYCIMAVLGVGLGFGVHYLFNAFSLDINNWILFILKAFVFAFLYFALLFCLSKTTILKNLLKFSNRFSVKALIRNED